jgi:flavin reductase (DIM6/NTAB) family NADH-FMN oxidoreductase RutF
MLFDFAKLSPRECHRVLISTIVPRPIAWVVTEDEHSELNLAPFSFFNVFAEAPPLICLGIGVGERGSGDVKDTGANIRRSGEFVVNLVSEETAAAMAVTGINFHPEVNELREAGLTTLPSEKVRPPRIAESPVAFECQRYAIIDLPTGRLLVLGQVVAAHVRDEAVLDPAKCYIDTPKLNLIGRMHGRGWYTRMTDWFQLPAVEAREGAVGAGRRKRG